MVHLGDGHPILYIEEKKIIDFGQVLTGVFCEAGLSHPTISVCKTQRNCKIGALKHWIIAAIHFYWRFFGEGLP